MGCAVISVQPLAGGATAASYYLRADAGCEHEHDRLEYYVNDPAPAGRWCGNGAAALGLTGALQPAQQAMLRELLDARFAGEQLARPVWRRDANGHRVDVRRSGFDVTFSAPKSVSVLMAVGDEQVQAQVRQAHAAAAADALGLLEQLAARAARGHQGDGQRAPRIATSGLIAVGFEHHTSRAGDPQLHTHMVIANLAQGLDGRWSALDSRTLHRQATTASYLYQHRLRAELTSRLGVGWSEVERGVAEVRGIPQHVRRVFSTRRAQIEAQLAAAPAEPGRATGGSRARQLAARAACLVTRPAKMRVPEQSLRERWHRQAAAAGFSRHDVERLLARPAHVPAPVDRDRLGAAVLGPQGATREHATFDQGAVLRELCQQLPAGTDVSATELRQLTAQLLQRLDVVPVVTGEGRAYTTVDMLTTEQQALALARRPGADHAPLTARDIAAAVVRSRLRPDQQQLVLALLTRGRPLEVITGPAGSGKTAALRVATEQWHAHGVQVRGAAVAALTAQGLHHATGAEAGTLTRLFSHPDQHVPQGGVLLVDEAGMVGTRELLRLLEVAGERHCKLVLVGDPAQLPEMEAGGLFSALTRDPDVLTLQGHGRQQQAWERHALLALRAGSPGEALDLYDEHGRLHTALDRDTLHAEIVDAYLVARAEQTDPWQACVLAARRSEVALLNDRIRQRMLADGQLGADVLHVETPERPIDYRAGDQVLVTRNDHRRGLLNGTTAAITELHPDGLTLTTTDGRSMRLDTAWLARGELAHGYAMTIHKAQGRTMHTALLIGDTTLGAEAGYVGLSRGTHANHLYLDVHDDPRGDEPCRPAPTWRRPVTADRRAERHGALARSHQQHLASEHLQEGLGR